MPCARYAGVSEALWERALTVTARERLAQGLGLTPGEALAWTRALAGAHDIGKASPTFQALWGPGRQNLEACVPFPRIVGSAPHGVISTLVLAAELQSRGTPKNDAETLARAIGGHHGSFPRRREQNAVGPNAIGTGTWDQVRAALLEVIFWIAGEPGRHPNSGG